MNIHRIKRFIEERYNVKLGVKRKLGCLPTLRQYYYKLAMDQKTNSLTEVGELVNRDHATVLYGIKKFKDLYDTDRGYMQEYNALLEDFNEIRDEESITISVYAHEFLKTLREAGLADDISLSVSNKLNKITKNIN